MALISRVVTDIKAKIHKLYAQQQIWEFTIGCDDNNLCALFVTKIPRFWLQISSKLRLHLPLPLQPLPDSPLVPGAHWHQWEGAQQPASAQIRHPPLASSQPDVGFPLFSSTVLLILKIKPLLTEGTCLFPYPEKQQSTWNYLLLWLGDKITSLSL